MRFFDRPSNRFPLDSVLDYREKAQKRLPKQLYDFLEGGAFNEVTLRKNREDFEKILLKRQVLQNVSCFDSEVEILGQKISLPLALAPVGFAGVYARRGEIQAAQAASNAHIPFSLSTTSICSIEEIAERVSTPFWFQFYLFKDRQYALELLQRAENVGCPVLLMTVDLPVQGARNRYNKSKRGSRIVQALESCRCLSWWWDVYLRGRPLTLGNMPKTAPILRDLPAMRLWMGSQINQGSSWSDVEWVRKHWKGKLVIKGILDPEDALQAEKCGADGIVVSNHGGRHVDGTLSSIGVLPSICQVVKGKRITILLDGGVVSGLDLVKALALGADACMIGKPWIWGLAARGEEGVNDVLSVFRNELRIVMAHLGIGSIKDIDHRLIIKN